MKKPIIGIVARAQEDINGNKAMLCYETMARSINQNGGQAILLLPNQNIEYNTSVPNEIERLTPAEMPDAFFCNCDETAYRMIKTLEDAGYKVPEDIAVVGYDDYSSQIPEGIELTTYRVNIDEMVRQCVHIVTQRSLNANYRRGVMLVHGDLIERKTVLARV